MHAYLFLVVVVSEMTAVTDLAGSDKTSPAYISNESDVDAIADTAIAEVGVVADFTSVALVQIDGLGVEVRRGGASPNVALVTAAVAHLVAVADALIAVQVDGVAVSRLVAVPDVSVAVQVDAVVADVCAGGASAATGTGLSAAKGANSAFDLSCDCCLAAC
jgi:hypothetical protein